MSSERAAEAAGPVPGTVASNPSITVNNGSVNIAVEGDTGDLWFYWEDSSGAFHQETVTPLPTCRNHAPARRRSCESGSTNMRAVGAGSGLEFYWATDGSSTWTAETGRVHESARARAACR